MYGRQRSQRQTKKTTAMANAYGAPPGNGKPCAELSCRAYVKEASTVAGQSFDRHNFDANISQQDLVDSYLLLENGSFT